MARRKSSNITGIRHLSDVPNDDIWIAYTCLECNEVNYENIGKHIVTAEYAYNNFEWKCKKCEYIHSKNSDIPKRFDNWDDALRKYDSLTCQRFWQSFFRLSTANPENYWKQCTTCGRVLPSTFFAKHTKWSELEKQQECKSCKAAINAIGNPKRTKEQLREGTTRRRLGDLMNPDLDYKPYSDIKDIFKRFGGKCFMTGENLDINNTAEWAIDHILPATYFYPLTKENAALLSAKANGDKRAKWPSEVYNNSQLLELSRITGADINLLSSPTPILNTNIDVNLAVERYIGKSRSGAKLHKKAAEIVKVLKSCNLIDKLSEDNKKMLGLN